MSEPYRIRLRGHWEVDGGRRVRRFGKPRLADLNERVWLVIEGLTGNGSIDLNGTRFSFESDNFRQDVGDLLLDRNTVSLAAEQSFSEVWLEIA